VFDFGSKILPPLQTANRRYLSHVKTVLLLCIFEFNYYLFFTESTARSKRARFEAVSPNTPYTSHQFVPMLLASHGIASCRARALTFQATRLYLEDTRSVSIKEKIYPGSCSQLRYSGQRSHISLHDCPVKQEVGR
jgi:hypothetical protein